MGSYVELALQVFKLLFLLIGAISKFNDKEFQLFTQRMKLVSDLLKKAVSNELDVLDEKAYLSNMEWEKQNRYSVYKHTATDIIEAGGGITELLASQMMGMGIRLKDKKDDVLKILTQPITIEEKVKLIAKIATEIA